MSLSLHSQTLPQNRATDWTIAGLRDTTTAGFQVFGMQTYGATGNGVSPNDSVLNAVLSQIPVTGAILEYPQGNFLFHNPIQLPGNVVLRGAGAENTTFSLDLGGANHGISMTGNATSDTSSLAANATKDSLSIIVLNALLFSPGDWVQLIQQDSALITSGWAFHTVGQIVQIDQVTGTTITLKSPLRLSINITNRPYIVKLNPVGNTGIECIKINRIDNCAPLQTSNIFFKYAVNCWISGIESNNCTFSHVEAETSSNLQVSKSYFHHAFEYGEGGRGYGVILHFTSNECRVEDNIFHHLRHSMLVQAGANGNVFSYNYSADPYWTTFPNNSSGDMVLHGNYVFANLFEQNICQNIVIDNSHGPNGPYNTYLRNRAGQYGIFFSAANSPSQNFLGNEIPNTSFPYSLVNYTILGSGHFVFGNNNKGTIVPAGTANLPDSSYAYSQRPSFVPVQQWAAIGSPNIMGANTIPAMDRYGSGNFFANACNNITTGIATTSLENDDLIILPNPFSTSFSILTKKEIEWIRVYDVFGNVVINHIRFDGSGQINTSGWHNGMYSLMLKTKNNTLITRKLVKIR
jgi:hypothetical protein